jgi:hypothetical protein
MARGGEPQPNEAEDTFAVRFLLATHAHPQRPRRWDWKTATVTGHDGGRGYELTSLRS